MDEGYRRRIVQRLEAGRMTSPLFDTERWVRNFEKVFSKMWEIPQTAGNRRSLRS